jgi:membrane fusion protein (multidrug efflux system)
VTCRARGVPWRFPAGTLALGVALATGCGPEGAAAPQEPRPATVEVMRVTPELLLDVAVFSGQLDAEHSVLVKPEIEGVVESVEFEQGQAVKKGDVLFRLRSREQAARLREARAHRELARQRWRRAEQLVERDASSLDARDVAKAEYEVAQAREELAQLELDRTTIRAPFDGVVGQRLVDIGERLEVETELVRVDAIDRLQLTFGISDEGLPVAHPGMKVQAWVRPYPGQKFPGEVFFVSPTLDPRNRRIWVKAWIDNADRKLAPGLFANVDLEVRRIEDALVVPESAVGTDRQGPYLWRVDDDDRATRIPIEIGLRERGVVEVIHGLSPGTRIVTAGIHKLDEGDPVRIAETPLVGRTRGTAPEGSLIGEGS